ncbi:unnamed protein product, partial [Lymnaea stagnalis]
TISSFLCFSQYFNYKQLTMCFPSISTISSYQSFSPIFHLCFFPVMCFSSIKLNDEKKDNQKLTNVSLHALATFFTNLSMAVMFASSTLAIKLMEPITSAMTQYFFMGTPM